MRTLILTKEQLDRMIAHAKTHAPLEACGLLAGQNARVEEVIEIPNQARSEVRFVMDPVEQLKAFERIENEGLELLGIFHSHPNGPETVSPADIAEAAYPVTHVIIARTGETWKARGFWIEGDAFQETPLQIL